MTSATVSDAGATERALRALLRALWFGVIPALFAGVVLRHLVLPSAVPFAPEPLRGLGTLAARHQGVAYALLFLGFAALTRYWRFRLPGGRFLTALSARLALSVPSARLEKYSAAAALHSALGEPGMRRRARRALSEQVLREIDEEREVLGAALAMDHAERLEAAHSALALKAKPLLRARAARHALALGLATSLAAAAALAVRGSLQIYRVASGSMLPTLDPGCHVLVDQRAYRGGVLPRRGDIVVSRGGPAGREQDVVKRVIGLPGDRIEMHLGSFPSINGWHVPRCDAGRYVRLYDGEQVNGRVLVEFLDERAYLVAVVPAKRPSEAYVVKPGEVFVLGDNRDLSRDSRNWNEGKPAGVPLAELVGRVDFRLLPEHRARASLSEALLRRIGVDVTVPGVDMSALTAGIESCLKQRPVETTPPEAARVIGALAP
jgi:signal peptidase I